MKYYIFLLMALYFWGCASTKNTSDGKNTRIFSANRFEVNNVVIKYLTDEGWNIESIDEKSGLIKTNLKEIFFSGARRMIRLSFGLQSISNIQTKVEVNVFNEVGSGAGVRNDRSFAGGRKEQKMDESEASEYNEQIFKNIENYLKR
jgi:hypothetical protein